MVCHLLYVFVGMKYMWQTQKSEASEPTNVTKRLQLSRDRPLLATKGLLRVVVDVELHILGLLCQKTQLRTCQDLVVWSSLLKT